MRLQRIMNKAWIAKVGAIVALFFSAAGWVQAQQSHDLLVSVGQGGVVAGPNGLYCAQLSGGDCQVSYSAGSKITITAIPADGYKFDGFDQYPGVPCGKNPECTLTMDRFQSYHARFSKGSPPPSGGSRKITVTTSGTGGAVNGTGIRNCGGRGYQTCDANHMLGYITTLEATPDSDHLFVGWAGGSCAGMEPRCTFRVTSNKYVHALFTPKAAPMFPMKVINSGNGAVVGRESTWKYGDEDSIGCGNYSGCCSSTWPVGTTITFTTAGHARRGMRFTGWGGDCSGIGECTVTMDGAKTIYATYAPAKQFKLDMSAEGFRGYLKDAVTLYALNGRKCHDSMYADGYCGTDVHATYHEGEQVTLFAGKYQSNVPNVHSEFEGWSGACTGKLPYCTLDMNSDKTVTAHFAGHMPPAAAAGTSFLTVKVHDSGLPGTLGHKEKVIVFPGGISCIRECSLAFPTGTELRLEAVPVEQVNDIGRSGEDNGTAFQCWSDGSSSSYCGASQDNLGSNKTLAVTLNADKTVGANFSFVTARQRALSVSYFGQGIIEGLGPTRSPKCGEVGGACSRQVSVNGSVTITATPASGYVFQGWSGDCAGTSNANRPMPSSCLATRRPPSP